jgi:hypothetical protein
MHYINTTMNAELISVILFCKLINKSQDVVNNLLMSNEAFLYLSGFVNKQNCHYWSATNSKEIHERPLRSSKVTVW